MAREAVVIAIGTPDRCFPKWPSPPRHGLPTNSLTTHPSPLQRHDR